MPKQKEKYQYTSHYNTTKPSTTIQSEIIPGASDIELTGDVYLEDDKTLRLNPDGSIPVRDNDVGGMTNLFAGITFNPVKTVYLSFTAGPSFIRKRTYLGVKPALGFYFSKTRKWTAKFSYINIANRADNRRRFRLFKLISWMQAILNFVIYKD